MAEPDLKWINSASGGAGFVNSQPMDENLPAAMEAEVYVNGKLEVRNKKKGGKKDGDNLAAKKRKEMQKNRDFAEICGIFRGTGKFDCIFYQVLHK